MIASFYFVCSIFLEEERVPNGTFPQRPRNAMNERPKSAAYY